MMRDAPGRPVEGWNWTVERWKSVERWNGGTVSACAICCDGTDAEVVRGAGEDVLLGFVAIFPTCVPTRIDRFVIS